MPIARSLILKLALDLSRPHLLRHNRRNSSRMLSFLVKSFKCSIRLNNKPLNCSKFSIRGLIRDLVNNCSRSNAFSPNGGRSDYLGVVFHKFFGLTICRPGVRWRGVHHCSPFSASVDVFSFWFCGSSWPFVALARLLIRGLLWAPLIRQVYRAKHILLLHFRRAFMGFRNPILPELGLDSFVMS